MLLNNGRATPSYTNMLQYGYFIILVRVVGLEPTSLAAADFLTTIVFTTLSVWWSGLYLHHSIAALDARRLVSTRSKIFLSKLRSVLAFYSLHRI